MKTMFFHLESLSFYVKNSKLIVKKYQKILLSILKITKFSYEYSTMEQRC